MLLIQLFIIAFAGFAVWRTIFRFREGVLGRGALVAWLIFWLVVVIAVAQPQVTSWVALLVGVGRGVDAAIYISVIVLFYLVFRVFLKLEKIEHDITLLVREISLRRREEETEQRIINETIELVIDEK
ncbi:DUF2304 family protein [Patescibacteria group bacterium]|nr:DUF2304 family protein [Patescibacteria group bacterium]MBU1029192.1 DUF2304 family protein [Patescibacteria group bacterium]